MIRQLLIPMFLILASSTFAQVTGSAFLDGQTDHSGIVVEFRPVSPAGVLDSATTDAFGEYSISLVTGAYEVNFSRTGYQNIAYSLGKAVLIENNTELRPVTLAGTNFATLSGNVSGILSQNTTYLINQPVTVPAGQTLTIEPGTHLQFAPLAKLTVEGNLVAVGTNAAPIYFQPKSPGTANWGGIFVDGRTTTADTFRFEYCLLEGAGYNTSLTEGLTLFEIDYAYVSLQNNIFRHGKSIEVTGNFARGIFRENEIYDHFNEGMIIYLDATSDLEISCNYVHDGNGSNGILLRKSDVATTALIENNVVHGIDYLGSHGIAAYAFPSHFTSSFTGGNIIVRNNIVFDCTYGISAGNNPGDSTTFLVEHNLVFNCDVGLNVSISRMLGTTRNNGILNCGYGILEPKKQPASTYDASASEIIYNGLYNNVYNMTSDGAGITVSPPAPVTTGLGEVVTMNANGDSSDVYYNIFDDPGLDLNENFFVDFIVNSAWIDAGDPTAPADTNGTVADIGLRRDWVGCIDMPMLQQRVLTDRTEEVVADVTPALRLFPNPTSGTFQIEAVEGLKAVEMYGIDGRQLPVETIAPGKFRPQQIASGLYLVRIVTRDGVFNQRLIIK